MASPEAPCDRGALPGPRICPGRTLALVEMKALLAMLYRNFEVERVGPAKGVTEYWAFTMMPAGRRVRLTRRPAADGGL